MTRRSYDQYCGLAGALDLVGERWSLLVVRELMTGPKRYSDLLANLPGVGTSLLAARLRTLEHDGIVRRVRIPPPAASSVYELTESGDELGRALMPLIRWGLRHAVPETPGPAMTTHAAWSLLGFTHELDPAAIAGIDARVRFEVDGAPAELRIAGGRARVAPEGVGLPDAVVRLSAATVAAIGAGRTTPLEAVSAGLVEVEGDADLIVALTRAMAGSAES